MAKSRLRQELFRAVEPAEAQDLRVREGRFRNPLSLGLEVKYFATSLAGAVAYARQASARWGAGPFIVVRTSLSADAFAELVTVTVDGRIEAVAISTQKLQMLSKAVIISSESVE